MTHIPHTSNLHRGPFLPPVWFAECGDRTCDFREQADDAKDARQRSLHHVRAETGRVAVQEVRDGLR